ncbi:uncharacterized protein LOC125662277 [Ostrea edulis]|uniref:uncharacterized protein LOC125662277 n=1 Tax=Ostrea edulis TaxID=37623 RepID=UPI0024AFF9A7|nr:uncharacterized protein LOC125662277 [Ostrea edulis]
MAGTFSVGLEDFLSDEKENITLSQLLDIPTQQLVVEEVKPPANNRFATPVTGNEIKVQQEQAIPKKTREANHWSYGVWTAWVRYRNTRPETTLESGGSNIPEDICQLSNESLNFWLQRFVVEIRRQDGTNYPPNTLTQIISGLQRYLRNNCTGRIINFFKDNDLDFVELRRTLDGRMKYLTSQGIGIEKKRCDPVTVKDEIKMWDTGVFSLDTASGLSNAVFFYNGKTFGFRGMEQHKSCAAEQFEIGFDHENDRKYVKYTPRVTKNVQGGLKHRKIEIKPIIQYDDPENPRCLVKIYEKYLSLIPRTGHLYRKPLETVSSYGPKFGANAIPINQMSQMFKRFYAEAGIDTAGRNISNHSGRVTCCTRLYNEGFSDKAVTSRSSHRSNAVHTYQREQFKILNDISNTLGAPAPISTPTTTFTTVKCESNMEKGAIINPPAVNCETSKQVGIQASTGILKIEVPENVGKIIIVKGEKKMDLEI